jgi:putative endonuclease
MNNRSYIGSSGEALVRSLYQNRGFVLAVANFYNSRGKRIGEIDLIAIKGHHLHFIEVKSRSSNLFGTGAEAVTQLKKIKLLKVIKLFLAQNQQFNNYNLHIDVVVVEFNYIDKQPKRIKIYSDAIYSDY